MKKRTTGTILWLPFITTSDKTLNGDLTLKKKPAGWAHAIYYHTCDACVLGITRIQSLSRGQGSFSLWNKEQEINQPLKTSDFWSQGKL